MGGRGASSGTSKAGSKYGSQYDTLFADGNVKFVTKVGRGSETLMETATKGRVYVHAEGGDLKSIVYFDGKNKRAKQIDLDHTHLGTSPHAHEGYLHSEFRKNLTTEERTMVDRAFRTWENRRGKL